VVHTSTKKEWRWGVKSDKVWAGGGGTGRHLGVSYTTRDVLGALGRLYMARKVLKKKRHDRGRFHKNDGKGTGETGESLQSNLHIRAGVEAILRSKGGGQPHMF